MNEVSIFAAAVEKANPAERAAYVNEACRSDAELRGRVESLLAAHDRAGDFLERPVVDATNVLPTRLADTQTYDSEHGDTEEEARALLEPSAKPDSLGRIGQYEVLEVLGRGGFGIVYRAFDDVLQRVVAVKVLAPRMATTSPARKRFLREARSSAAVRHENVVQVYAVVEQPFPYLVMEYIPGGTLQQRIDRTGPLELTDVLNIGRQIAEGLAAAHATGLVHRDIKPANVLIENGPQARVKLTDFGLARAADDASMSQSGVVAGTPMYMAPEQARGDTLDHRADLFSLGSVLYVMCTGRPPFRASSTLAVLKRVADEQPRPIREIIPEVPEWFCRIVEKLHEKEPEKRFQSAREVTDLLADCERQIQAHSELTDLTRIPATTPSTKRLTTRRVRMIGAILAMLSLGYLTLWAYPAVSRYFSRRTDRYPLSPSVFTLRMNDTNIQYRIDGYGANQTGVSTIQLPLDPGKHYVWFSWRGKEYHTSEFELQPGERSLMTIDVRPNSVRALLNERQILLDAQPGLLNGSPDFRAIFNGNDLTGWAPHADNRAKWSVENGLLTAKGKDGYLATIRSDYRDFHLRAEVKINNNSDSGIIFRSQPGRDLFDVNHRHYEGDLLGGSYYHFYTRDGGKELNKWTAKERLWTQNWSVYEIVALGGQITILVDGRIIFEIKDPNPNLRPGPIILQSATPETVVQFRKIEIRELSAADGLNANDAVLKPLRDLVAAKEKSRDTVKIRTQEGVATEMELIHAEIDLIDSRIRLTQAERNQTQAIELLEALVNYRLEEKRLTSQLVEAGVLRVGAINDVDARLAEARIRLAETRTASPKP